MDSVEVVRKLAHLKLPLLHRGQFMDAISDAIACIESQERVITSYKSDLEETLDIVSGQKNVVRCGECANDSCPIEPCWRKGDEWFCADGIQKDT